MKEYKSCRVLGLKQGVKNFLRLVFAQVRHLPYEQLAIIRNYDVYREYKILLWFVHTQVRMLIQEQLAITTNKSFILVTFLYFMWLQTWLVLYHHVHGYIIIVYMHIILGGHLLKKGKTLYTRRKKKYIIRKWLYYNKWSYYYK